ncbi:MAG: transcription antitermination factor NusB [Chlamydiae bacterium]|nr:transcription antitermination factor NusB [Chlamydiota bacterium]
MALSQQKRREILFQLIFSNDFISIDEDEMNEFLMNQFFITRKAARDVIEDQKQIAIHLAEIDAKIEALSHSYEFQRIPKVELNVLRLAIYEMKYLPSIPPKVSIAEAIRLTRKYSTAESSSFINAVLDAMYQTEIKAMESAGAENELLIPVHV